MNRTSDRRGALQMAAALAVVPFVASRTAARAQSPGAFNPPAEPMQFTRRLRRELPDGLAIDVFRTFRILFVRVGRGFRVDGDQTGCRVDAPAALAPLAEIEERRVETGLFPMYLNSEGLIVAGPAGVIPSDMSEAVNEAVMLVSQSRLSTAEQISVREFVIGLQVVANRITSLVPPQLFSGLQQAYADERALPLPDGEHGSVTVRFTQANDPVSKILDHAERTVITKVGGTERRTLEEWQLARILPPGR